MNWTDICRETQFLLRKKSVLALLLTGLMLSIFSVWTGSAQVAQQHATIDRLLQADAVDRKETTQKYDDYGYIAYYTFHLTYAPPSPLAFAALGVRDVYPWKHRIRMLALEGQIHESDTLNPELALSGKIDFTYIVAVFAPLLLILLLHDLQAAERAAGRHDFLVVTARRRISLWPLRAAILVAFLWLSISLPFAAGALVNHVSVALSAKVLVAVAVYLTGWAAVCYWLSSLRFAAPVLASTLIGIWLLTSFVVPAVGNIIIEDAIEGPQGAEVLMAQREAVNGAWDKPHQATMDAFVKSHPQWRGKTQTASLFEWKWYYAFQQVGDEKAQSLSDAYQSTAERRYQAAGWVALLSPATLFQRAITHWANTDAKAAWQYEDNVRAFHARLRHFYYPLLFNDAEFSEQTLQQRPEFKSTTRSDNEHKSD